jgi:fibronectin-binding autotransporter adhesin
LAPSGILRQFTFGESRVNRTYRLLFNETAGAWQAAAETTINSGKGGRRKAVACAAVALFVLAVPLSALAGGSGGNGGGGTDSLTGGGGGTGGDGTDGNINGAAGGVNAFGVNGTSGGASGDGGSAAATNGDGGGGGGGNQVDATTTIGNGGAGNYLNPGFAGNGGNGGNGGAVGANGSAGANASGIIGGGGGGDGVVGVGGTVSGAIAGGSGGNGGNGASSQGGGGGGGGGGAGYVSSGSLTISSGISVTGGAGGDGGNIGAGGSGNGGDGGGGGAGVATTAGGLTLTNAGSITGGAGGAGGVGENNPADGTSGAGGAGVIGSDLTVINNGSISGGLSGDGTIRANAITFTGGANALMLGSGSTLTGNIAVNGSGSLNISLITASPSASYTLSSAITGDGSVTKSGAGTLTLSNADTYSGGTTINGGTLALGAGGSLAATGALNLGAAGATFDTSAAGAQTIGDLSGIAGSVVNLGANSLAVGTANSTSFAGAIADGGVAGGTGGSLVKQGTGTLTLTGTNTYTGTTTINAGTLQIGDGGTTGSPGAGNVTLTGSATLAFDRSDTYVVANAISDDLSYSGSINQNGTGTTIFTGDNTYTAQTNINAGTLQIGNGGTTGSLGVANAGVQIASGAVLTFDRSDNISVVNSIGGAGSVTQSGTGVLTLSGDNTYSGGTTVYAGLINFGLSSDLGVGGNITLNGGGLQWRAGYATDISSRLNALGTSGGTFDTNGNDVTFASGLTGTGGMTKQGAGTLTLSGASTYTGATTVSAGMLQAGAANVFSNDSAVTVSAGATLNLNSGDPTLRINQTIGSLAGAGNVGLGTSYLTVGSDNTSTTFSGAMTADSLGGLIKQGTGTLILNGDNSGFYGATEVAAGTLEVGDIDNPQAQLGGTVQVDATGTLRGHGSVLGDVANNGTVAPGGTIGTLTIGGNYTQAGSATLSIEVSPSAASLLGVTGTATLAGTLALVYDPGTYSAKQYTLVSAANLTGTFSNVTSSGAANLGTLTPTISYTGTAVDLTLADQPSTSTPTDTPAPIVIAPQDTSIYTAVGTTALLGAQATGAALLDRAVHASATKSATPDGWVSATGSLTKVGGTNSEPGFQSDRYGFLAGLEQTRGDYTIGVVAGYDHAAIDEQHTGDSGTTDTLRAALYGSRFVGPVNLAATAGVGLDFLAQKRPFPGIGTAEGDHVGQDLATGMQASLPMAFSSVTVTPRIGLRYAYFHANGFGESGAGGQDLNVGTDNAHSLQSYAGVTLDKVFGDPLKPTTVQLRVSYARELLDVTRAVNVTAQDGTLFPAPGTNLPRGYLTTGISLTLRPTKQMDVSLNYDTVINTGHASVQQGSVRVGYQF